MTRPSKVPGVWDLLKSFKESCRLKGWKISGDEDIVRIDDEYHDFIGTRTIHPITFRKIVSKKRRAVHEGRSYRVVEMSYTAWVFQKPPPNQLAEALKMDSELFKNTALYDLSEMYEGKPFCLKLNKTDSPVFGEFEKFLKKTYGIEMKPLYEPRTPEHKTFKSKLLKASLG